MKPKTLPQKIDPRRKEDILNLLQQRLPGYIVEWQPTSQSIGQGLLHASAGQIETLLDRLNHIPFKQKLAFLETLGICLIPAQSARAPIVFELAADASDSRAPRGTQLAAPPPPDGTQQIVFETEQTIGLSAAKLTDVFSLWPGRDSYINHQTAVSNKTPFTLLAPSELKQTKHHIYIAHKQLLALSGEVELEVQFDLIQNSDEPLETIWEYWDGNIWRGFVKDSSGDGTRGWQQSGRLRLVTDCADAKPKEIDGIEAYWLRGRLDEPLPPDPAQTLPLVDGVQLRSIMKRPLTIETTPSEPIAPETSLKANIYLDASGTPIPHVTFADTSIVENPQANIVNVNGLPLDQALVEDAPADVTKPFYPLGQMPQPGSAFYFTHESIFSKPGAEVELYLQLADTPQNAYSLDNTSNKNLPHSVQWEYWNGRQWNRIDGFVNDGEKHDPRDFTASDIVKFTIPLDMALVTVNDIEARWVRVRLISGGYAQKQAVSWNTNNTFSYVMPRPPALATVLIGYTWQYGPFKPDQALTYNDFTHDDVTEEASWPGRPFLPFSHLADQTPAVYLGFDKPLPVDRLSLFWHFVEDPEKPRGAARVWEYWDGFNWRDLAVQDETNQLRVPGMVSFINPANSRPLARFGTERTWLRSRLKTDAPPDPAELNRIYFNAVWAAQQQTITNEPLGVSNGRLNQQIQFRQYPILPNEQIELRELSGARAAIEWRILVAELFDDDPTVVKRIEEKLQIEGTSSEIIEGTVRLIRDRTKRVSEVWVRWQSQPTLAASKAEDRHYTLANGRGLLQFGDGQNGRVPPAGVLIRAAQYRTGGGKDGNVGAETITQQLAGVGGVEALFNPTPAEGGADGETVEAVAQRGPYTIRHQGRALSAVDYETMAYESSSAVAVAYAQPFRDYGRLPRPGRLTLTIIPWSKADQPWPTFGLRQHVLNYIADRAPADVIAAQQIYVTGPAYQTVNIFAVIAPTSPEMAGILDEEMRSTLRHFFHPLYGGTTGKGWRPGQPVYLSDVVASLHKLANLDAIQTLEMSSQSVLQRERVKILPDHIAAIGDIQLQII